MMAHIIKLSVIIALILSSCRNNAIDEPEITIPELQQHINYLASDKMQGRYPGTGGDLESAGYIRDELASWGLLPAFDNGLQAFEIVTSLEAGENNKLIISGDTVKSDDFMALAFSASGAHKSSVVFAGYGFDIESDTLNWDDYANTDIGGKWLMILRGDPEIDNASSDFARVSGDRYKVMMAKDRGAAGVILVSGNEYDASDEFEPLAKGEFSTGIPVFRIKRKTADLVLGNSGYDIIALEKKLNETYTPFSFELDCVVEAEAELLDQKVTTYNVAMILPGNDPALRDEYIIVGGHYDHLGLGGPGTSSRAIDTTGVHYGADDNASGIASMLELAEKFAAGNINKRSIIFAAFGAEEMGLLGSKHLASHLPVQADKVNAMINLDMVGRLNENRLLQIGGTGTAGEFNNIIESCIDTTVFRPALSEEGYGPSDHSSFYGKNIPVLYFSTGAHLDYHTPYDSPGKINYEGLADVSELVYTISKELAGGNKKLVFTEAGKKIQSHRGGRGKSVTLGIMPDFAGNIKNGLRADFVSPGKPADLGGMKKGDIITAINGKEINNIQDYMFRLSKLKQGETIQVEIMRGDKKELLLIAL